jgi:hypothetical protein
MVGRYLFKRTDWIGLSAWASARRLFQMWDVIRSLVVFGVGLMFIFLAVGENA